MKKLPAPQSCGRADDQHDIELYSGSELTTLMAAGELDCVLASRDIFIDAHQFEFLPVAGLIRSKGGASMVVLRTPAVVDEMKRNESVEVKLSTEKQNSFAKLLRLISNIENLSDDDVATPLLMYPYETFAESHIKAINGCLTDLERRSFKLRQFMQNKERIFECAVSCGVLLVFCWEPYLSRLRNDWISFLGEDNMHKYKMEREYYFSDSIFCESIKMPTIYDYFEVKPPPYISMDLIVRKNNASFEAFVRDERFIQFLREISKSINSLASQDLHCSDDRIKRIASYFGITNQQCYEAIQELNMNYMIYPQWHELITESK